MGSLSVVEAAEVLAPDERTLAELAGNVNREHELVGQSAIAMIEHAIAAGEDLLTLRDRVSIAQWRDWVAENLTLAYPTVCQYMRFARFKHVLMGVDEPITSLHRAQAILTGLPPTRSTAEVTSLPVEFRERAVALRDDGMSQAAIAEILGVSPSTVGRWLDPAYDERSRVANRQNAAKRLAERNALKEQERQSSIKRAVRKAGAATQEAWAMAERMQDVLAQAHRETEDREARRALSEAGVHYRKMRDEIVRALGVS